MEMIAVGRPDVPALTMPDRFRMEIVYFMTPSDQPGVPTLASDEYWIRLADSKQWLDEGMISIVSPLSAETKAEIELTEYHEKWLEWLLAHQVEHVKLVRN